MQKDKMEKMTKNNPKILTHFLTRKVFVQTLNTLEGQAMFKEQRLGQRCLQFTGKAAEIAARAIVQSNGQHDA